MWTRRPCSQRGAATTEYVLLLGLIAIVVMTSVKALGATSSSQFAAAAASLGDPAGTPTSTQPVSDGSGGGTADTTAPATTTPPTTTPPTTVPPTTTTLPPVATQASTTLTAPTVTQAGSKWSANSLLMVTDDLGAPVPDARVTVTVSAYTRKGNTWSWVTTTEVLTAGSDGAVALDVGPYKSSSGSKQVTQAIVAVSAVTLPNGLTWDGDASTITINSP